MAVKQIKDYAAVVTPAAGDLLIVQQAADNVTKKITITQIIAPLKAQASGLASLNGSSKVVEEPASKAQASGLASLDASSKVVQDPASKGLADGVCDLDASALIPIARMPASITTMTGLITMWGTTTAPTGWLLCNGTAVSRTTYATLFGIIGTTFGSGNGSTTFNLPDFQGLFPVGRKSTDTDFDVLNDTGGEKTHALTEAELAAHTHNYCDPGTQKTGYASDQDHYFRATKANDTATASAGSGDAHQNLPPFRTINFIIKY